MMHSVFPYFSVIFPYDHTLNLYESSNVLYLKILIQRHKHDKFI